MIMRSASDFNSFYSTPDPWGVGHATFRDKVLRHRLEGPIRGKSVLELGCGEGHLTQAIYDQTRSVKGIDISEVAIARARALNLPNATFESSDFLSTSFEGYDVITAIECIYYLSPTEQDAFFDKVAGEHPNKLLICQALSLARTTTESISPTMGWSRRFGGIGSPCSHGIIFTCNRSAHSGPRLQRWCGYRFACR